MWQGATSYPPYLLHQSIGWAVQLQLLRVGVNIDATVLAALAIALLLASALHR